MPHETNHLSDQEILRAADDELSARHGGQVRAHLASCDACRARIRRIQNTFDDIARLRQSDSRQPLPPADGPRALLKARLAASAVKRLEDLRPGIIARMTTGSRWAVLGAAVVIAALGTWVLRRAAPAPKTELQTVAAAWLEPVPDRELTPGATLPVTKTEVCRAGDTDTEQTHPISVSMQQRVFQEYRTPESHAAEYEVDFLITPGLGGADDIRNLWLEPYSSTVWNAHVKDALEDRLHNMVCAGQLDLATAQHDIATDWISAYKKYFHTQSPVPTHSARTPDQL